MTLRILAAVALAAAACAQSTGPLGNIADLVNANTRRISSYDRSGGNDDWLLIPAGKTATLADIAGAGSIRHIWITFGVRNGSLETRGFNMHLRDTVLRMYWDGETDPSVETPVGDFFGTGFGMYHNFQSLPLTVQARALNCYFPMPFSRRALVTVTNESGDNLFFYYHIDYEEYPGGGNTSNQGRFHAQWRRENPTRTVPRKRSQGVNKTDAENYIFIDAAGGGHFVGVILNVQGYSTGWPVEGDDMFFIDGEPYPPSLHGTGMEDYFNNAFGFQDEFNYPFIGFSRLGNRDGTGVHTMYRFHIQDPIRFRKSIRGGVEHGHANIRSDDFSSVAYWYQTEPHKKFDPLPPARQRMPNRWWRIEPLERKPPGA